MFISKMALPRRTVLRGMGATLALPFLDAMVPALTASAQDGRESAAPVRRRVRAARRAARLLDARHRRIELRVHADPQAAREVPEAGHGRLGAVRPARRTRDDGVGVAERRAPEEDVRRRRLQRRNGRSGHRPQDRAGDAAAVARARHRGLHRLHRRLRHAVQLRVHEHDLVVLGDDAGADGDQSARRVRAAVRTSRNGRAAAAADADRQEHPGFADRRREGSGTRAGGSRPRAPARVPGPRARGGAPHSVVGEGWREVAAGSGRALRHSRGVGGTRAPDVRAGGAGLPGGHHASH